MIMRNRVNVGAGAMVAMALTAALLTGCGGGGGGGGSSPGGGGGGGGGTNYTVTGKVIDQTPLSGVTVEFDNSTTNAAKTDSSGNFSITVPKSAVTGADTVTILIPSGASAQATVTDVSGVPQNLGTLYVITGTLLNNGALDSGIVVKFNGLSAYSTTTNSAGNFALVVPPAAITGSDSVFIYQIPGIQLFTPAVVETNGVPQNLGTKDVALMPPPPFSVK